MGLVTQLSPRLPEAPISAVLTTTCSPLLQSPPSSESSCTFESPSQLSLVVDNYALQSFYVRSECTASLDLQSPVLFDSPSVTHFSSFRSECTASQDLQSPLLFDSPSVTQFSSFNVRSECTASQDLQSPISISSFTPDKSSSQLSAMIDEFLFDFPPATQASCSTTSPVSVCHSLLIYHRHGCLLCLMYLSSIHQHHSQTNLS